MVKVLWGSLSNEYFIQELYIFLSLKGFILKYREIGIQKPS